MQGDYFYHANDGNCDWLVIQVTTNMPTKVTITSELPDTTSVIQNESNCMKPAIPVATAISVGPRREEHPQRLPIRRRAVCAAARRCARFWEASMSHVRMDRQRRL